MVGRRACPPRLVHIHGRTFLRHGGPAPRLRVRDETSNEHGANCLWARLACEKPFVYEASTIEEAAASEFVWRETPTGCRLGEATADCMAASRDARTAASIFARIFFARRVLFTSGKSTIAPVVQIRALAVGPSASSNATHARAIPDRKSTRLN